MIKIVMKSTNVRNIPSFMVSVDSTPLQAFEQAGVGIEGSNVTMNGSVITGDEINSTFAELGVESGAEVRLSAVVKADGAR